MGQKETSCPSQHVFNGPWPLNSTGWHGHFLNSTCDMGLYSDMWYKGQKCSDMGHSIFLNSTCDIEDHKPQRHSKLPFLKIDMRHWGPHIKGPYLNRMYILLIVCLTFPDRLDSLTFDFYIINLFFSFLIYSHVSYIQCLSSNISQHSATAN